MRATVRVAAVGLAGTLVLAGCAGSDAVDRTGAGTSSATSAAGDAAEDRLRDALAEDRSRVGELLDDPATSVREEPSPFPGWTLLEVVHRGPHHPSAWTFAVSQHGEARAVNLAAAPEAWTDLVADVQVTGGDAAADLAVTFLELTHAPEEGVYLVEDVDDIRWLEGRSEHAKKAVAADRRRVEGRAHAPKVTRTRDGWSVALTAMHQERLVEHEMAVGRDGEVEDQTRDLATGLATSVVR